MSGLGGWARDSRTRESHPCGTGEEPGWGWCVCVGGNQQTLAAGWCLLVNGEVAAHLNSEMGAKGAG